MLKLVRSTSHRHSRNASSFGFEDFRKFRPVHVPWTSPFRTFGIFALLTKLGQANLKLSCCLPYSKWYSFLANMYFFKFDKRSTRKSYEIYSKLTIKTPEWRSWSRFGVFIINFEHTSRLFFDFEQVNVSLVALYKVLCTSKYRNHHIADLTTVSVAPRVSRFW